MSAAITPISKIFNKSLDLDDFVGESRNILSDYICCLCKGVYINPVIDPIGHIFCKQCINTSLEKIKLCPQGGEGLEPCELGPVKFVEDILEKQTIYCRNRDLSCSWMGKFVCLYSHMNDECDKQVIVCENKNCRFESMRESMSGHSELCQYRKIKCKNQCNINVIITPLTEKEHLAICPREKILCPKICGTPIEREELENHYKNSCANFPIDCDYQAFGCNYQIPKRDIELHLKCFTNTHNDLALKYFINFDKNFKNILDSFSKRVNDLLVKIENVNKNLLKKEKFFNIISDSNSNTLTTPLKLGPVIPKNSFNIRPSDKNKNMVGKKRQRIDDNNNKEIKQVTNSNGHFINAGIYSDYMEKLYEEAIIEKAINEENSVNYSNNGNSVKNNFLETGEDSNTVNSNETLKNSNNSSDIILNNITGKNLSNNNSNNLIGANSNFNANSNSNPKTNAISLNYNELINTKIFITSNSLINNDQYARFCTNISPNNFKIDLLNKSRDIFCDRLKATCKTNSPNEHKFVFLTLNLNKINYKWKVILNNCSGWIAIGICIRDYVYNKNTKKYEFSALNNSLYNCRQHGTFLISMNGYTWNNNNSLENNKELKYFPQLKSGDSISMSYDCEKKELTFNFTNNSKMKQKNISDVNFHEFSEKLTDVKSYKDNEALVPCVILMHNEDSVFFEKI